RSGAGKYFSGSQSTQAANFTACWDVSKRVIGPTAFSPRSIRANEVSTSNPRGLTVPRPVITTRRMRTGWEGAAAEDGGRGDAGGRGRLGLAGDVVDRVADGLDLRGVLVGDGDLELVLELHDQLDHVQGIRPEVVHEGRLAFDLLGGLAEVVAHDLDHTLFD